MKSRSALRLGGWMLLALGAAMPAASQETAAPDAGNRDSGEHDWPQFRGPGRDGVSRETGLLKAWPAAGPEIVWRAAVGEGSAGVAIAGGRVYTLYARGGEEFAVCLDETTGEELWKVAIDAKFENPELNGPRMTPTVDGDRVYVASAPGKLYALDASDGSIVWRHDLVAEFGAEIPFFGFAVSPLVDGGKLYVSGGGEGSALLAFDAASGDLVWRGHTDKPGYASPVLVETAGVRQVLFMTHTRLISTAPDSGKIFWSFPWTSAAYYNNIATPISLPDDRLFISTGYGVGSAVLRLSLGGAGPRVEEVWRKNVMRTHFHSCVYLDGHLYGFDNFLLKCIDAERGLTRWVTRGFGEGSLIAADGHLLVFGQRGKLALVEASPAAYREKASAQMLDGRCYANPSLAGGKLFVRNEEELLCLRVAPAAATASAAREGAPP